MKQPIKKSAIGWLCRLNSKNARALAVRSVQEFAESRFGSRLSERQLRKLSPILCQIDDSRALFEAIQRVRSRSRQGQDDSKTGEPTVMAS